MDTKILKNQELNDSIAVVVGTRPSIVKMSPIIRSMEERGVPYLLIHTGQHYSPRMDEQFFLDLELPTADYRLDETSSYETHGGQTAVMLRGIEEILIENRPWCIVVGGDANTNLAGALAGRKLGLTVAHVEAGLRSGDWQMPEEHNRVMIDHISEVLFAPTELARHNLNVDNVKGRIEVVGNTVVDAVQYNKEIAKKKSSILQTMDLEANKFGVVTAHREENVDDSQRSKNIVAGLQAVTEESNIPLIFPIHPRTRERFRQFGLGEILDETDLVEVIDPVGYFDFISLLSAAQFVITDSGGIQEEACIVGTRCFTIRENTERPETIKVGANSVVGTSPGDLRQAVAGVEDWSSNWHNPFGAGDAGQRIVDILLEERS